MNFACSARARGLDISNVLVFATDEETKELAEGVGLAAYFDKRVSHLQRDPHWGHSSYVSNTLCMIELW